MCAVVEWLGYSVAASPTHYTRVPDHLFAAASGAETGENAV